MFILDVSLQGASVLEDFSTARFCAWKVLVQMLLVVVPLQNFLAFTGEGT